MLALGSITWLDKYAQIDFSAGTGCKGILFFHQIAGHQSKQVARLGKWIFPGYEMATTFEITSVHVIAVGQQHRATRLVCLNTGAVSRHHIGTIREIGNAAETLGFTLGAKHS